MNALLHKFLRFVLTSGVGWIIDFGIFTVLTRLCGLSVLPANYLSSLPAVTFVFLVSTRKTFVCRADGMSKQRKYLVYVLYQFALVSMVSVAGEGLYRLIAGSAAGFWAENAKLISKILITPITMLCNFFVLRQITEKW